LLAVLLAHQRNGILLQKRQSGLSELLQKNARSAMNVLKAREWVVRYPQPTKVDDASISFSIQTLDYHSKLTNTEIHSRV
jgi:hypothetical protein